MCDAPSSSGAAAVLEPGAGARADLQKLNALVDENAKLGQALLQLQQRSHTLRLEHAAKIQHQGALLMQARALVIGKDTLIDALRTDFAQLQASIPGLASRTRLGHDHPKPARHIAAQPCPSSK